MQIIRVTMMRNKTERNKYIICDVLGFPPQAKTKNKEHKQQHNIHICKVDRISENKKIGRKGRRKDTSGLRDG